MNFYFSSFIINERDSTLTKNAHIVEIEPKIFSLLCYFCNHSNRAISREELIEKVWLGRIVSDAAVNRAIGELRKIIEDNIKDPQHITTVSKVGYRFNAVVTKKESKTIRSEVVPNTIKILLYKNKKQTLTLMFIVIILLIAYLNFNSSFKNNLQLNVSEAKPLTMLKGNAFKQKMYKNGQIVFLHRDSENTYAQLWLQAKNSAAFKLTNDSYYYTHAIFMDSDTIFATRFDNLEERNCQIVKLTISTKKLENIHNCSQRATTYLAYNPISRKLYFNYRERVSQPYNIQSIQIDTKRSQQLTHSDPEGNTRGDYLFSLSPDNKEMAIFEYQQDGGAMLKVIDINNTLNIKRYQPFYGVSGIAWFNEHTLLITSQDGIGLYNLVTKKRQLLVQNENITQADYSQGLSLLSYVKFDTTRNIYQLAHDDTEQAKALTHSPYINFHPTYANTSNKIVYLSTDSGELDIQLTDQQGNVSNLRFPLPVKHIGNFKWAEDDSFIIASINSKLYQYFVEKKQWYEVEAKLKNIHYVEAKNSQYAIVSSDQSGDWQLWEVELASGKAKQITQNGGYSVSYIASNNTLLISKYSQEGMFQFDLNTQVEIKVKDAFKITDWNKWQVRGDNMYFWQQNHIIKRNLNTGNEVIMWEVKKHKTGFFNVSFDESKLAYKVTEHEKASIWQSTLSVIMD